MLLTNQLLSPTVKAGLSAGGVAAVAEATSHTIQVPVSLYNVMAVCLALAGVYAARQVTIIDEEDAGSQRRTYRQTGPLTLVGILIICPFIWHFEIPIPWASLAGLGVGYSVRLLLRILADGTTDAFRAFIRRMIGIPPAPAAPPPPPAPTLDAPGAKPPAVILPPTDHPVDQQHLIERLNDVPDEELK